MCLIGCCLSIKAGSELPRGTGLESAAWRRAAETSHSGTGTGRRHETMLGIRDSECRMCGSNHTYMRIVASL